MNPPYSKLISEGVICWHILCLITAVMEPKILGITPQIASVEGKASQDIDQAGAAFSTLLLKGSPEKQDAILKKTFETSPLIPLFQILLDSTPFNFSGQLCLENNPLMNSSGDSSNSTDPIIPLVAEKWMEEVPPRPSTLSPLEKISIPPLRPLPVMKQDPNNTNITQELNDDVLKENVSPPNLYDHPKTYILGDNLNASSENLIKLHSIEETSTLFKSLSGINPGRIEGPNGFFIEEPLIADSEKINPELTDHPSPGQAKILLQRTSTSSEIMPRLSDDPLLTGLDLRIIPAEFNAPPVESLWVERLEFLTGFTDPLAKEEISQAEKKEVFELKDLILSFHPPKGKPNDNQLEESLFPCMEEEKASLFLNSKNEEVLIFDSAGKDIEKIEKVILEEEGMSSLSENQKQDPKGLLFSDPNGSQKMVSHLHEAVKSRHETFPVKTDPFEIYQQISRQIIWSPKNNGEKIKLALDPPQLGNIYMEINREKENIKATLWTDNLVTKEILEAHQVQLYKILKEEGFKLEKFEVLLHQDMGTLQQREENFVDRRQQAQGELKGFKIGSQIEQIETTQIVVGLFNQGSQYVDLFI